jgi:hypothetical protein
LHYLAFRFFLVVMGKTLLILAAGMGSRFGGLKQLEPVGPSGEVMLDYSIFDAIAAGFDEVVFVIRRDFERAFRETVVARYAGVIPVKIAYQELGDLPDGIALPAQREKPWGTGQAVWAARHAVAHPFLAINADDFYGRNAFAVMGEFLAKPAPAGRQLIGLAAYRLSHTLSEHGAVSRGVCRVSENRKLEAVEEHTGIERTERGIQGVDRQGQPRELSGDAPVSMNFWGFSPQVFPRLEGLFRNFLTGGGLENPKAEFYIPSAVSALIASGEADVTALSSDDHWLGITYREDRAGVCDALRQMVENKTYPTPLWKKQS